MFFRKWWSELYKWKCTLDRTSAEKQQHESLSFRIFFSHSYLKSMMGGKIDRLSSSAYFLFYEHPTVQSIFFEDQHLHFSMQYVTYFINFNIRQNREDVEIWKDVSKSLGFLAKTSVPWLLDCVPTSLLGI